MTTPAVSVLMPVLHPHPVYFPEAVRSVLAQTLADWELVIVEDPSDSSAAALLAPLADPRIRLITNPARTGLIAQRNRTLAEARADLVAFLDADDLMEPTRLAEQAAFLAAHPDVTLVGSQLTIIDPTGRAIGTRTYPTTPADILRAMPRYNAVPQPASTARKAALLSVGGYAFEYPAEDYDLWSRLLTAGHKFAHLPTPLTRYRVHPESGSKGVRVRRLLELTAEVKRRYWWRAMSWADRLRYWGERCLQPLPQAWVARLFAALTFRRPRPAAT